MTTNPVPTGVTSTSWYATFGPMLAALGVALYPLITHQPTPVTLGATIAAGVVTIGAFVTKVWHDIQRRKLDALGSDAANLLPMIQSLTEDVNSLRGAKAPGGPTA